MSKRLFTNSGPDSTGDPPVLSGDPPDGRGEASRHHTDSRYVAQAPFIPAGGAPVPPTLLGLAFAVIAAGLLAASVKLPLWQMRMEAPQYRDKEALRVTIYPNAMTGDLREISVLNQYIGVHIPSELPQLKWLPIALITGGALGVSASLLPSVARSRTLLSVGLAVTLALAFAAVQAQVQMYDIGHKRDAKTKLARVRDFTPHVLGTSRLAQFTLTARLGTGSFLIAGALALQFGAAWLNRRRTQFVSADVSRLKFPVAEVSRMTSAVTPNL